MTGIEAARDRTAEQRRPTLTVMTMEVSTQPDQALWWGDAEGDRSEVQLKRPPRGQKQGWKTGGLRALPRGSSWQRNRLWNRLETECQRRDLRPELQEPSYRER